MVRAALISVLCLALALMGVSGVHAHLLSVDMQLPHAHDEALPQQHHMHADVSAEVVTLVNDGHFHEHDEHGDIDFDVAVKAFGKVQWLKALAAVLVCFIGFFALLGRLPGQFLRLERMYRPPKNRLRLFFLPPSHAPPVTAFSR